MKGYKRRNLTSKHGKKKWWWEMDLPVSFSVLRVNLTFTAFIFCYFVHRVSNWCTKAFLTSFLTSSSSIIALKCKYFKKLIADYVIFPKEAKTSKNKAFSYIFHQNPSLFISFPIKTEFFLYTQILPIKLLFHRMN